MSQIKLRVPKINEYIIVNKIISKAFKVNSDSIYPNFFSNSNIYCIVAIKEDEIVGTASLHIIQKTNRKNGSHRGSSSCT